MEFKEVLKARHSVRKFKDEPVDRALIDEIVEEASYAPSSHNSRSSGFMIIEDKSVLEAVSAMRDSGSRLLDGAAAAIVVLGDTEATDLWVDNAAISATYILLSAADKGLGACWVHVNGRPQVKADPSKGTAEQYLRELLGIKENMRPPCVIALGYEAE